MLDSETAQGSLYLLMWQLLTVPVSCRGVVVPALAALPLQCLHAGPARGRGWRRLPPMRQKCSGSMQAQLQPIAYMSEIHTNTVGVLGLDFWKSQSLGVMSL